VTILKKALKDTGYLVVVLFFVFIAVYIFSMPEKNPNYDSVVYGENFEGSTVLLKWISGTEYVLPRDHNGSSIVTLRDNQNDFINTSCFLTILFPNRSIYLEETLMNQDTFYGAYFLHWLVPESLGVFDQNVKCRVLNKNISSAKSFHISNATNVLLASTNSLNQTLNTILNVLNCSDPSYTQLCDYLQSINNSVENSAIIINSNLTAISSQVISINETLSDSTRIYYEISSPSCPISSQWIFEANVSDESYHILRFLNCSLFSSRFGIQNVPFDTSRERYRIVNDCDSPEDVVTWNFSCSRIEQT